MSYSQINCKKPLLPDPLTRYGDLLYDLSPSLGLPRYMGGVLPKSPSADCRYWGTRERGADRGEVADLDILENRITGRRHSDMLNTFMSIHLSYSKSSLPQQQVEGRNLSL
jgi:hypothetical protein